MAAISASMVKELRQRTSLGMMECKKALVEADGDLELAIENLRKSSGACEPRRKRVELRQMVLFVSRSQWWSRDTHR